MGCCSSRPEVEPVVRRRQGPAPALDICFPEKRGAGGYKVATSCATSWSPSSLALAGVSPSLGRAYTRMVVAEDWLFAALFETHACPGDSADPTTRGIFTDAAAQYCAEACFGEYEAHLARAGGGGGDLRSVLAATLRSLDHCFLTDPNVLQQDRLGSGCSAVLLHLDLAEAGRVATTASLGPCAAVLGQRQGGLASSTSEPLLLCGGGASSHDALVDFLTALAAERREQQEAAATASAVRKGGGNKRKAAANPQRQQHVVAASREPRYTEDFAAPQALGFGVAKGMAPLEGGTGGRTVAAAGCSDTTGPETSPRVGVDIQTSRHMLLHCDESVVLLGAGAAATLSPADAAQLMHRMAKLSAVQYEAKPDALETTRGQDRHVVQLDSLGLAGPRPAAGAAAGADLAVPPFNAARLLVRHAAAAVTARRGAQASALPGVSAPACCVLALSLQWPHTTRDPASPAAAAVSGSVDAVAVSAAAALRDGRRGLYRWQQVRGYYKFLYKRRAALIARWHDLFDKVVGEAAREAKLKEVAAWKRMGAALQVSTAGNVKLVAGQGAQSAGQQPQPKHMRSPAKVGAVDSAASAATGVVAAAAAAAESWETPTAVAQLSSLPAEAAAEVAGAPMGVRLAFAAPSSLTFVAFEENHKQQEAAQSGSNSGHSREAAAQSSSAMPSISGRSRDGPLDARDIVFQEQPPSTTAALAGSTDGRPSATGLSSMGGTASGGLPRTAPSSRSSIPTLQLQPSTMTSTAATTPRATSRNAISTGGIPNPTTGATASTAPTRSTGGGSDAAGAPAANTTPSRLPRLSAGNGPAPVTTGPLTVAVTPVIPSSSGVGDPSPAPALLGLRSLPPALCTVTEPTGDQDPDLLSPDADQLAAWAQEAATALGTEPGQHWDKFLEGNGVVAGAVAAAGAGQPTVSGGGARPSVGSRIPLSPSRADGTHLAGEVKASVGPAAPVRA